MRTKILWLTKCNVAKFNGGELKAFRRYCVPAIKSTAVEGVNPESNRPVVSDSGQMARLEDRRFG